MSPETPGKLSCTYPGPAIAIPLDVITDPHFLKNISSFITQMDTDVLDSAATTRKAGSTVREPRDVTDPRYITRLLVGILRGLGEPAKISRITKRIADDVLWSDTYKPWRRSPLWLIIRVVLQSSLPPLEYKSFIVFFMTSILDEACGRPQAFTSDLLFAMRAKIARRLHKLGSDSHQFVADAVLRASKTTEDVLRSRWSVIQKNQSSSPPWKPDSLDIDRDKILTLPNSKASLLQFISSTTRPSMPAHNIPTHPTRLRDLDAFPTFSFHPTELSRAFGSGLFESRLSLSDFEKLVEEGIDDWVERRLGSKDDRLKAVSTLKTSLEQYLIGSDLHYPTRSPEYTSQEDQSIRHLTLLELWMGIDKLTVKEHPLLQDYSPEIPSKLLEPLLLRHRAAIDRAHVIEKYIRERHAKARPISPSIFSSTFRPLSFPVRYTRSDGDLTELRQEIEQHAARERATKEKQLRELNNEHSSLMAEAAALECSYVLDKDGDEVHSSHCSKCGLKARAKKMSIQVHEWPLPEEDVKATVVIFELACPPVFAMWRDVTYSLIFDLGLPRQDDSATAHVVLPDYPALKKWARGRSRISLASSTKPFMKSHYSSTAIPANASSVCVNNGLKFQLFDITKKSWISSSSSDASWAGYCTPGLSKASAYKHLQYAVAGTAHTHNQVIVDEADCTKALSLHEHMAFGSLRIGGALQWMNIARELRTMQLAFHHPEVFVLMFQAVSQLGPLSDDQTTRDWHIMLEDLQFGTVLVKELGVLLKSIQLNWLKIATAQMIVHVTTRLLASAIDGQVKEAAHQLLEDVRAVTYQFIRELVAKTHDLVDEHQLAEVRNRICETAATFCSTFDVPVSADCIPKLSDNMARFIECAIHAQETMPTEASSESPHTRMLLQRHWRLLHALEPHLRGHLLRYGVDLDIAVKSVWPSFCPGRSGWQILPKPNSRYLHCTTSAEADSVASYDVLFNALDGELLVNCKPIGRLPGAVLSHSMYGRVFGQKALDVLPSNVPGTEWVSRSLISGYELFFALPRGDDLVIMARKDSHMYQILSHTVVSGDFPNSFVEDHVHWLEVKTGIIEFRPLERLWESSPMNWHLHLTTRDGTGKVTTWLPRMMRGTGDYLVDIHSNTFHMLSCTLRPLESAQHIHVMSSHVLRLSAHLPRFKLAFFINDTRELESSNHPGIVVDENQSSGTMFGLENQLVLRHSLPMAQTLPRSRRVIIPHGTPSFTFDNGRHTQVRIDIPSSSRRVVWYEYAIDTDLQVLTCNVSLISRLYKAYLHALTSSCLPDPLTGVTGTEEALHELQSASSFSFQDLDGATIVLLHEIGALTPRRVYYPEHKTVMQQVHWANLPFLAQHDDFHALAESVLAYHRRLEIFSPSIPSSGTHVDNKPRDVGLTRRAAQRNSICYPQLLFGKSPSSAQDTVHSPYQSGMEEEYSAFCTAHRTHRYWNDSDICYSSFPLLHTLETWGDIGTGSTRLSMSYSAYWIHPNLKRDWTSLYNSLRKKSGMPDKRRYDFVFSLAAFAFGEPDRCTDIIPALLAIATSHLIPDQAPAPARSFELSDGYEPVRSQIARLVRSASLPMQDTPSHRLPSERKESKKAIQKRRRKDYEDHADSHSKELASRMHSSWPQNPRDTIPGYLRGWINIDRAIESVSSYFESCRRNIELKNHVRQVEKGLGARSPPHLSLPSERYSVRCLLPTSSRKTLRILDLSAHPRTSVLKASKSFVDGPDRMACTFELQQRPNQRPMNTQKLADLLSEVVLDGSENVLRKQYVQNLEQSLKDLRGITGQFRSDPSELPPEDTVRENRDSRKENMCAILGGIQQALSAVDKTEEILALSGLWPRTTPRSLLSGLNLQHRQEASSLPVWREVLMVYARALIEYQRSQRLLGFLLKNKPEDFFKELDNTAFSVQAMLDNPDWLLIQIQADFFARPLQLDVASQMIAPMTGKNTVLQLNMGEGKSAVIVPFVSASLADGQRMVRVEVLKPLAKQMFNILTERLGGVVNRRIFYMPFSRNIHVNEKQVRAIQELYEECMRQGGILVIQPEHILSFKLMGLDRLLSASNAEDRRVSSALWQSQRWLDLNSRDILDESDELLHVLYQLIYTVGEQRPLEDHPYRWTTTQQVLTLVKQHATRLLLEWPNELEISLDASVEKFPSIRITGPHIGDHLMDSIADDVIDGALPNVTFSLLPPNIQSSARQFLTAKSMADPAAYKILKDACSESSLWPALLLLRGLLNKGSGILLYALTERRWRVDFGLDPSRSLMAVPYRAKDVPSLKAEFGHPDVAVVLTCLSYYYGGLTTSQVLQCFDILFKLDNPSLEYESWVRVGGALIPEGLRKLDGVNTIDTAQVDTLLVPLFRGNHLVVNFFLSNVVFPCEAKVFEHKLATSGWDLAESKTNVTTGFSGTKDNRYLLPTSITQQDSPSAVQRSTDALVLLHLLQPENNSYVCASGTIVDYLHKIEEQVPEIRVLLDVGAQMLDMENEELARCWLEMKGPHIEAAVFFTKTDDLKVLTRDGAVETFISSSFSQQLDKCIVYLDDAHTRGTDLKLPAGTRAAVTLGQKVTKDRVVQGSMRMRQLGVSQSVMFIAPAEIDRHIRKAAKLSDDERVQTVDVLRWAMLETCADIERHIPHWAEQGIDYKRRSTVYREHSSSSTSSDVDRLSRGWLRPEGQTLEQMYGLASSETDALRRAVFKDAELSARLKSIGVTDLLDTRLAEEQEREVNHEVEREREVERPLKESPAIHEAHDDVRWLIRTGTIRPGSSQFLSFDESLGMNPRVRGATSWSKDLMVTKDFARTTKTTQPRNLHDYLRPVNWILSCKDRRGILRLVALSPFEVNEFLPIIRKGAMSGIHLHLYAPHVVQSMEPFSDLRFFCIPPLPVSWTLPSTLRIQLGVFAGQLYLDDFETYMELCKFLGLYMGHGNSDGIRKQSDGFVRPRDRPAGEEKWSPFQESPVAVLKELVGLRRKGMTYLSTHMGQVLSARKLRESRDFGL
ncbi:hypothetical protein OF83DRAFT_1113237 [Amylostereum chailletii]|nr:hypothetical protein OF83DRAFT_1113237 [Amylostereum chailletii]